jgi:hypothetical protein
MKSKREAGYLEPSPDPLRVCAVCRHFDAFIVQCPRVTGFLAPWATCDLFGKLARAGDRPVPVVPANRHREGTA